MENFNDIIEAIYVIEEKLSLLESTFGQQLDNCSPKCPEIRKNIQSMMNMVIEMQLPMKLRQRTISKLYDEALQEDGDRFIENIPLLSL